MGEGDRTVSANRAGHRKHGRFCHPRGDTLCFELREVVQSPVADAPIVAGKYQLLRQLGAGGMAEVYLAKQVGIDGFEKLVVVKRILPSLSGNKDFITMFLDEARTAADLRHANVVNIFEVGEDDGNHYMAMEYLHGQDIRSIQRKVAAGPKKIPLQHSCQIALDAASGLFYAHQKTDLRGDPLRIIHRDVSPQNILVTYDGATKIVDFGIAKAATQDAATATGIIKGKYTYMSPEQATGEPIDPRSDQYALGIVFWEMLTMRRLFKRDSVSKTLQAIMDGDIPSPRVYAPDLPVALEQIVMRALSSNAANRFPNCQDFVLALEDFLAREGIAHSPARLSQYLKELFSDTLEAEKVRGIDSVDHDVGDAYRQVGKPNESTTNSRRGTGGSASGGAVIPIASDRQDLYQAQTALFDSQSGAAVGPRHGEDSGSLEHSGSHSAARSGSSRRGVIFAGLAAFLLVAGAMLAWMLGSANADLVVHSAPSGAQIYLDGLNSGQKTPHVFLAMDAGKHRLRLSLPGYEDAIEEANIRGTTRVDIALKRQPAPVPKTEVQGEPVRLVPAAPAQAAPQPGEPNDGNASALPASAAAAPSAASVPDAVSPGPDTPSPAYTLKEESKKSKKRKQKRFGRKRARLRVVLQPWGEVWVDGKRRGITPLRSMKLKPGKHTIRMRNPDLGIDVSETVELRAGEDRLIKKSW